MTGVAAAFSCPEKFEMLSIDCLIHHESRKGALADYQNKRYEKSVRNSANFTRQKRCSDANHCQPGLILESCPRYGPGISVAQQSGEEAKVRFNPALQGAYSIKL